MVTMFTKTNGQHILGKNLLENDNSEIDMHDLFVVVIKKKAKM